MSYILEALKKADEKRKAGAVPDLDTIHEVPIIDPRRPLWVYGLAAVLLVNAGLIGWWLWSPRRTPVPAQPPPVAVQPAKHPPPAAPRMTAGGPASPPGPTATPGTTIPGQKPPAPGNTPAAAAKPPALANAPAKPAPPALPLARLSAKAPAPPSPPGQTATTDHPPTPEAKAGPPPPASPAEAAKVVPMLTSGPPATAPAAQPSAEEEPLATSTAPEAAAEARSEEEPPPVAFSQPRPHAKSKVRDQDHEDPELAKIPLLKQLPADFRQSLPELHLSFLSYSIHPESRLVSISGKVLREGQDFDDNIKLETITPNGVVLNDKGHRFRLNMD
ncbi:MAG: general secretion pathway protein GspB [Desulfobacteraceae bacterium]|nr:general secretion pathway protein GspB [Desulfobacteraceae bacterium]